ncbi:hypothetical protein K443DRAFT_367375 [Laccaria amethystina LaAM-08-1]|uniref:Uncharacterized protein n=1 Tax=Laccaria amethystina LaAM-08-1 TaxID=1095629 RepID=A0A0C9Y4V5_9AGAR|nr:hypothetical protein K443DRAFT_367375 [Laccaria amethystina LaAM-08-1]
MARFLHLTMTSDSVGRFVFAGTSWTCPNLFFSPSFTPFLNPYTQSLQVSQSEALSTPFFASKPMLLFGVLRATLSSVLPQLNFFRFIATNKGTTHPPFPQHVQQPPLVFLEGCSLDRGDFSHCVSPHYSYDLNKVVFQ